MHVSCLTYLSYVDVVSFQLRLQIGNFHFAEVEDGGGKACIHRRDGLKQLHEILYAAGAAGSNDRNRGNIADRLEHFQNSEFRCRENALAITALEEALLWLRKRTMGRERRGVEGTHIV